MNEMPLVFIHGSGCDQTVWSGQVDEIGDDGRIILIDLPGRGAERTPPTASFQELVDHARSRIPAAPGVVVGHSLGAAVALSLALEARAAGVVLVGAAPKVAIPESMADKAERNFDATLEGLRRALFHKDSDPRLQEAGLNVMRRVSPRALANDLRAASSVDFTNSAHNLSIPALFVCGSHDRVTPPTASMELQRLVGGGLEVIDGAGHMPMLEKRTEFNSLLRRFWGDVAGRSSD